MKKTVSLILAVVMMTALLSACFTVNAAETLPTPTFLWNLLDKKTENGNYSSFYSNGSPVISKDGNIVLHALDGDDETSKLFIWFGEGVKLADIQVIVAKFKHNRTEVQGYNCNLGLIGKTAGEEKYAKPVYANTTGWQTMYFDVSNAFTGDANYLVWFWHEIAKFECTLEIEYIAAFSSTEDANKFVAGYDAHPISEGVIPTPGFFWNLIDKKTANGNYSDFYKEGQPVISGDGNIILEAKDGDDTTGKLFVWFDEGMKMQDCNVIVAKIKHDRTEVQPYNANLGIIGKTAGEECYAKPVYAGTTDWQYVFFDVSTDFTGDANYLVWFWHEAAKFNCNIELEYIAGFKNMSEAKAFAARYDKKQNAPETGDALFVAIVTAIVPVVAVIAYKKKKDTVSAE